LGFRVAATPYAIDQWALFRKLPDAPKEAEDEDDDRRPRWDSAPLTAKREWKASIALMKRRAGALAVDNAAAPFRVSLFPSSLLHAEADLKPKKAFKEASLRTNVAGACGLAFARSGEMASVALGRDSSVITRLDAAIAGETAQDAEALLQILKDTREDLTDVAVGLKEVARVGTSIAAGSFNQGIDDLRHQVWESTAAKCVRPTLELCPPSLTHLFGDDLRVKEAMEAERRRPYQAAPFRPRPYANQRSGSKQEPKAWPKKKKFFKKKGRFTPAGKANGPASKKGEGQNKN
jgi:hypothetical protein